MTDGPIIFSGAMPCAILNDRKTQTRRVVKRTNSTVDGSRWKADDWAILDFDKAVISAGVTGAALLRVPIHEDDSWHRVRPMRTFGDRLWVKEIWRIAQRHHEKCLIGPIMKRGEGDLVEVHHYAGQDEAQAALVSWRPPIFMPRWASRITLEVKEVRVERVRDITEADAKAEGVGEMAVNGDTVGAFAMLWDSRNANLGHGWDANPWVWVVEFERMTP